MIEQMVGVILLLLGGYFALGMLFAIAFVLKGAKKIDPAANEGTLGFKLLIIPGSMLFWPLLLRRWVAGATPPEESSAHRVKARANPR